MVLERNANSVFDHDDENAVDDDDEDIRLYYITLASYLTLSGYTMELNRAQMAETQMGKKRRKEIWKVIPINIFVFDLHFVKAQL